MDHITNLKIDNFNLTFGLIDEPFNKVNRQI